MNVFIVGGTGLIGSEVAQLLIKKGHNVSTLTLPDVPVGANIPKEMTIHFNNYLTMNDKELLLLLKEQDAFIFAAGIDERIEAKRPIYDLFKKYNIDPLKRMLDLIKQTKIKDVVVLGSYFTYFNRIYPKYKLTKYHPYIRSRVDQLNLALSYANDNLNVSIIELPYIFGVQKGRKPVWVFLVEIIKKMKRNTLFPNGGTTMITTKQAAQGIVGALLTNKGGHSYPLGYYNLDWKTFLNIVHEPMGYSNKRKVITIPRWLFKIVGIFMDLKRRFKGYEGGLLMRKYAKLQTRYLYIDKEIASIKLGIEEDDIKNAIKESIKLSLEVSESKDKSYVGMTNN